MADHWIPDSLAAALFREAYSRAEGPTEKRFDLVLERCSQAPGSDYAMWRFYAVKKHSNSDAAFSFGMKAAEIVASKVLSAVGPSGDLGDAADAIGSMVGSSEASESGH